MINHDLVDEEIARAVEVARTLKVGRAADEVFSNVMEQRNTEAVLGDRRHGF